MRNSSNNYSDKNSKKYKKNSNYNPYSRDGNSFKKKDRFKKPSDKNFRSINEIDKNKIKEVYIAYGGMAAVPKRAKACEKILKNKPLNLSTFNQAKNYLDKDLSPIGDMRASKEYRLEIAKNLLMKCFVEIDSNKLTRVN